MAASSGIVLTVATTATAAPQEGSLGLLADGDSEVAASALAAMQTAPAVSVAADATWAVDDIVAGAGSRTAAAVRATAVETTRDATLSARTEVRETAVYGSGETSEWGAAVVALARQYVGTPYRYGGKAPGGFDCSGFTSYIYGQMGVSLSSSSAGQYGAGRQVSAAEAQPGDLVWWPGHVGIYTGNGQHIAARNPGTNLFEGSLIRSGAVFFRLNG